MNDRNRMALIRLKGIEPKKFNINYLPFQKKICHPKFNGCRGYIDLYFFHYPSMFEITTNQPQDMPNGSRGYYDSDTKSFEVIINKIGIHLIMNFGLEYSQDTTISLFDLYQLGDTIKEEREYIERQKQRSLEEWF